MFEWSRHTTHSRSLLHNHIYSSSFYYTLFLSHEIKSHAKLEISINHIDHLIYDRHYLIILVCDQVNWLSFVRFSDQIVDHSFVTVKVRLFSFCTCKLSFSFCKLFSVRLSRFLLIKIVLIKVHFIYFTYYSLLILIFVLTD